ncbi:transcriptional coactivator p15/PC4 family protein [candidate division WOR-3 bacterium]|nr:transcriptional coactivator p15/PC4 family protein [candidate division WOR-3 bacterium]
MGIIEKSSLEQIQIEMKEYKKKKYLDIRTYYQSEGEWKPSKKGVTIHPENLDSLLEIISEIKNQYDKETHAD